ncbi:MAG: hypothetical protein QXH07_05400 [Thermoplasmata archaeon]
METKKKFFSAITVLAIGIGLTVAVSSNAHAGNVSLSAGYAGENVHFSGNNGISDSGWLNGFYVGSNYVTDSSIWGLGNLDLGLKLKYLTNTISNNSTGASNIATTKIELNGGFDQKLAENIVLGEYGILGYDFYHRRLKNSNDYTEDYKYGYVGLGAKIQVDNLLVNNLNAGLNVSGRWSPSWSSINYMASSYGEFDTGNGYNFKVEVPLSYNILKNLSINLNLYYSYWHFGSSNSKNIVVNNVVFQQVEEPSHEINSTGLDFGMTYKF